MIAETWNGASRYREPAATLPLGFADDVPIDHDPLDPHPDHPTPLDLMVRLTRSERETRNKRLVEMAWNRYDQATDLLRRDGKTVAATCLLTSGGNDSMTVAHLFRSVATHVVHANTGTGIEATRVFVREQAAAWALPLLEVHPKPGEGYFDLVRGTIRAKSKTTGEMAQSWPGGFPGPAAHAVCYQRLKERGLATVPHLLGILGSRTERALQIAGRRRSESFIRRDVPHFEIDGKGTLPWSSPIAVWHKADLRTYRLMQADTDDPVPVNPVAQMLGMSGECGCLANGTPAEAAMWREKFPDDPFILAVNELEAEIADRDDIPEHRKKWGNGGVSGESSELGAMCGPNCAAGVQSLPDDIDLTEEGAQLALFLDGVAA